MPRPWMEMQFFNEEGQWTEKLYSTKTTIAACMASAGITKKDAQWNVDFSGILGARAALLAKGCTLRKARFGDDSGSGLGIDHWQDIPGDPKLSLLQCDAPFSGILINFRSPDNDLYQTTKLIRGVPDTLIGGDPTPATQTLFGALIANYYFELGIPNPQNKNLPPNNWLFKCTLRTDAGSRQNITFISQSRGGFYQFVTGKQLAVGSKVKISGVQFVGGGGLNGTYEVVADIDGTIPANGFIISEPAPAGFLVKSRKKVWPLPLNGPVLGFAYPVGTFYAKFGNPQAVADGSKRCSSDIIYRRKVRRKKKKKA